jgi:hypothetical protein
MDLSQYGRLQMLINYTVFQLSAVDLRRCKEEAIQEARLDRFDNDLLKPLALCPLQ